MTKNYLPSQSEANGEIQKTPLQIRKETDAKTRLVAFGVAGLLTIGFTLFVMFNGNANYAERIDNLAKYILPIITAIFGFAIGKKI